nr:hypothetical protein [Desulfobacula sp.]
MPRKKTFRDKKSHTTEMEVTLNNGETRNLLMQTSAITDPDGRILYVMEMATDVTVIHQLQDHLAAWASIFHPSPTASRGFCPDWTGGII